MDTEYHRFPIYFYSYNEIETFCLSQREQLTKENAGLILGILRGGGIPALMLSQMLGIPVDFIYYNRREAKAEIKNKEVFDLIDSCIKEGKKILLIDDIAGVGYTLGTCYRYLLSFAKDQSLVKVMTLVHHENSRTKPDYFKDCSAVRAILPWERYVTSRACMDDFARTEEALIEDQRYKKTLAISDSATPLSLKHEWKVDYQIDHDGDYNSTMDCIKTIGPEEIYCNNELLTTLILEKFPFIIIYKIINQKRYKISSFD